MEIELKKIKNLKNNICSLNLQIKKKKKTIKQIK